MYLNKMLDIAHRPCYTRAYEQAVCRQTCANPPPAGRGRLHALRRRVADVSINTVFKLHADAGVACAAFHDEMVRNVRAKRVQCDEIWSFVYAKAKNVKAAKAAPDDAGDVWTWTAIDADTKLIVSWLMGGRDAGYATEFMQDVAARLAGCGKRGWFRPPGRESIALG